MPYSDIIIPVPGQPVSKSQYGDPVKAAIDDLDLRVTALVGSEFTKWKDNNETRTSTTTLALDNELKDIPLSIGRWKIFALISGIGGAGGIAIKTQWAFTGTWNTGMARLVEGPSAANTADPVAGPVLHKRAAVNSNVDSVYGMGTSGSYNHWTETSAQVVVTAPGLFGLNWAPNVSSGTSGGVRQSSFITCTRIA
jgi:hypothetical protein